MKKKIQKRIDLRSKIAESVDVWAKRLMKVYGEVDSYALGCQVANEIVPYIQGAYRRRKR